MEKIKFGFEDLEVWQRAIEFARSVLEIANNISHGRKRFRLIEQLESASTSIALNIAEGKGRYSKKEFVHFLYVARGSLFETLTLLIILNKYNLIKDEQLQAVKDKAVEISKMLSGLINFLKYTGTTSYEPRTTS